MKLRGIGFCDFMSSGFVVFHERLFGYATMDPPWNKKWLMGF
uniref:Uncharacterized protein n=1 Tax=Anguilla anguilla TaxID=7936 RepID=A0A0E9VHU9_ANGAN